jgi:histidine triad (HIT) family protein
VPSLFTRIIQGELPGRFVWRDERCVAFLTIAPIRPGHLLVVPRREVDHWLDLEPELAAHLTEVARTLGRALQRAFPCKKVGLMIAGLEVPHTHLHVLPIDRLQDMDFANQDPEARAEDLDEAAEKVRASLRSLGLDARAQAIT